ncbi:MAG TPA: nitrate/nitrite transporter NrtS [Trichormus sp. M33_DOE_039]|nr:nitrate/nitrite transporter NrtS [Trichormus sp. M33_DOE_039]
MKAIREYCLCLSDKNMMPTALKVAVVVGSILFTINHGAALIKGQMTRDRWVAATLTYVVPYLVNIHGQYISRHKSKP